MTKSPKERFFKETGRTMFLKSRDLNTDLNNDAKAKNSKQYSKTKSPRQSVVEGQCCFGDCCLERVAPSLKLDLLRPKRF